MLVRIKNDAVGLDDGHGNKVIGSWVEDHRGKIFEVSEGSYATWVVASGNKQGAGIDSSQAYLIDDLKPRPTIKFNDEITLESGMTVEYQSDGGEPVIVLLVASGDKLKTIKIGDNTAYGSYNFKLTTKNVNKIWGLAPYDRITYLSEGEAQVQGDIIWEKKKPTNKFSSSNGVLTINKDGSVTLGSHKKMKSQVEQLLKVLEFDLADNVEVPVGCKVFTIKEIKEFKTIYEKFMSALDK